MIVVYFKVKLLRFYKSKGFCPSWIFSICSSYFLLRWKIFHKNHICNFFVLHELPWCESSNLLNEKRISHKNHIYNVFLLHDLCWCVPSDQIICHKNHICNIFFFHGLSWYASLNYALLHTLPTKEIFLFSVYISYVCIFTVKTRKFHT